MNQPLIAPSILSANFSNLEKDFLFLNQSEADWIHVDVMDGNFVPNISFGFPLLMAMKKLSSKPLDVHLMIMQPERYIGAFYDAGADRLSVHVEGATHLHRTIHLIKELGMKAGVAINPATPVESLSEIIAHVDQIILMSVNPGYGGQKFIPSSLEKIVALKKLIQSKKSNALIEIDGGVTLENAKSIVDAGADILVAGNTVFNSNDPLQTISSLKNISANTFQTK